MTDTRKIISKAIMLALKKSLVNVSKDEEPQLVANLVWHIPAEIKAIAGLQIKSAGVFIHQTPKVRSNTFKKHKSVELGDLLLLRCDKKGGQSRALLLQAKRVDGIPTTPDNADQHFLYGRQPRFEYVHKPLERKFRKITGLSAYDGCQYLLINKSQGVCGHSIWVAHPSLPQLSYYCNFSKVLVDFILGFAGREYSRKPRVNGKNWDMVIDDLVRHVPPKGSSEMSRASINNINTRGVFFCGSIDLFSIQDNDSLYIRSIQDLPKDIHRSADKYDETIPIGISIIKFVVDNNL